MERCFLGATADVEAVVEVELDARGAPTHVSLTPSAGTLDPSMQTCVKAVLEKLRAPCPVSKSSTVRGTLFVYLT